MNASFYRRVVYPLYHWLKRDGVNEAIRESLANQWLPPEAIAAKQDRKLGRLFEFATRTVPHYRDQCREAGIAPGSPISRSQLARFPILTKGIIRSNRQALLSEDLSGNSLKENSTSGSTGEAMRFFTDARSMPYRAAAAIRSDSYAGWSLGERVVTLWGAPMDQRRAQQLRGRLHGWITGHQFLSSYDLSPATMDSYIAMIQDFKPTLLVGYSGPLERFGEHCLERSASFRTLRGVISSAEKLMPHQRAIIERAFRVEVFDRYGCREVGQIAGECEAHSGMHISADRVVLEIVDDEGEPCAPGREGRIILTDLDNFGMPLIRYDIGDRGVLDEARSCVCGRGLPLLASIGGRTMELVRNASGDAVGGTFWTLLFRSRPGLKQFQVVQETLGGVLIRFVRDDDLDHSVLEHFQERVQQQLGSDFQVDFLEVPRIDRTASGKHRIVISRIADVEGAAREVGEHGGEKPPSRDSDVGRH